MQACYILRVQKPITVQNGKAIVLLRQKFGDSVERRVLPVEQHVEPRVKAMDFDLRVADFVHNCEQHCQRGINDVAFEVQRSGVPFVVSQVQAILW